MAHDHSGHHHHHEISGINNAFIIGILINLAFVIAEFILGYLQSSLALISDAGHNLTDVLGLLLSLFAFKMMKVKPTENYSYGYKKVSILASLINSILLIITTIIIFYEGFTRIGHPPVIRGDIVSVVAFELFMNDSETDAIIMIGEIGGGMEAEAARWIKENNRKPVIGFIAGQTAPAGRRMGHAGAIVGGADDTAAAKMKIMRECGITVCESPAVLGETVAKLLLQTA